MALKQWSFVLRLSRGLEQPLKAMAKDSDRSLNSQITHILKNEVIKYRKEKGEIQPDLFDDRSESEM